VTATVISGTVVRYNVGCKPETFTAGQSFYETQNDDFVVRNEAGGEAVLWATYVAPNGTPNTGLRIDRPQPSGCTMA